MRRCIGFIAFALLASAAGAQDTTVVVVRHLAPQQDTSVVVRHLAPAQRQPMRAPPRYGAPRYAPNAAVLAKDPNVGSMLSFAFPGGGQYYAGASGKGLAITLLAIGAPIVGYANVRRAHDYYGGTQGGCNTEGGLCRDHRDWTPAAVGLGVGITAWLYGVATAGTDVQRWNRAHGVRFVTAPGRAGFAVALP